MLRKIYIFFFFPFLNTLQEGEERRGVAARCSQVGSSKGATFFGNITSIWVVKKMKCANKKTKKNHPTTKLSNHVTSLRSSSGKIAVHLLSFRTNSKLPGFIQLIKKQTKQSSPPKKETKNVHNYNKNLSWKIYFFGRHLLKPTF